MYSARGTLIASFFDETFHVAINTVKRYYHYSPVK